jgi:phosphatidylserine decarboxylase
VTDFMSGALLGVVVAAVVIGPLAVKWQLPLGVVAVWTVVIGGVVGGAWATVLGGYTSWAWLLMSLGTVAILSGAAAALAFFRDPDRVTAAAPGAIVSPADGRVLYVRPIVKGVAPPIEKHGLSLRMDELTTLDLADEGYLVGIGMHLLNVHVNRAPIGGKVASLVHVEGRFLSLKREEAMTANERFTTVIEGPGLRIVVIQIASRLVRRIVSYLHPDQDVVIGQRIGMIRFGSQVDVVVPRLKGLQILASPGDTVKAGVSVLARLEDADTSTATESAERAN